MLKPPSATRIATDKSFTVPDGNHLVAFITPSRQPSGNFGHHPSQTPAAITKAPVARDSTRVGAEMVPPSGVLYLGIWN